MLIDDWNNSVGLYYEKRRKKEKKTRPNYVPTSNSKLTLEVHLEI